MMKFRQKQYGGKLDKVVKILPVATLGVTSTNLAVNATRQRNDKKYQSQQLEAMTRLTDSLNRVDNSLEKVEVKKSTPTKRGIKFMQKLNSFTGRYAMKGAALGGAVAGGSLPFMGQFLGKDSRKETVRESKRTEKNGDIVKETTKRVDYIPTNTSPKYMNKLSRLDPGLRNALIEVGGIAVGATLGALVGAIKDVSNFIGRKRSINNRLMKDVLVQLRKIGFREGKDYTLDPKVANLLKTKVCLVVSRSSDSLRLLINTVNDNTLKTISGGIVKNLPTMTTVTDKVSDKFNEINITTMTSNNGDAGWIASIAEKFIREGFPVYLVEVG